MVCTEEYMKKKGFQSPNSASVMWYRSSVYDAPRYWAPSYFARAFVNTSQGPTNKGLFYYIPLKRNEGPLFVWGVYVLKEKFEYEKIIDWSSQWVVDSLNVDGWSERLIEHHTYNPDENQKIKKEDELLEAIYHFCISIVSVNSEKTLRTFIDKAIVLM